MTLEIRLILLIAFLIISGCEIIILLVLHKLNKFNLILEDLQKELDELLNRLNEISGEEKPDRVN